MSEITWLTGLTDQQLWAAYGMWVNGKVEDGDNENPLSFDDWYKMEKSMAEPYIPPDFQPALTQFERYGIDGKLLESTGGGVFVLYHYFDPNNDQRMIGVSPSEEREDLWLVMGYEPEGVMFERTVHTSGIGVTVKEAAKRLDELKGKTYIVPVEFQVRVKDGEATIVLMPSEGSAGYFGTPTYEHETGRTLTPEESHDLWDMITNQIDERTETITVKWEN